LSTVTQNGVAKTRGHLIGETTVTAAMNRATQNFGRATIRVAPAVTLDIIDDHAREVEVGKKVNKNLDSLILFRFNNQSPTSVFSYSPGTAVTTTLLSW
jgi:hypothetical protein